MELRKDLTFQSTVKKLNEYGVHILFPTPDKNGKRTQELSSHVMDNGKVTDVKSTEEKSPQVSFVSIQFDEPSAGLHPRERARLFTLKSGLNVCLFGNSPIDYFCLMADNDMFKNILEVTNKNLQVMREENGEEDTQDLCLAELIRFVGLLLHMGTIQLNRIVDYWKEDALFGISCFPRYMTRNRFMVVLKCLQYSNLIRHFNNVMSKCYTPGRELAVKDPLYFVEGRFKKRPVSVPEDVTLFHCLIEPMGVTLSCSISSNRYNEEIVPSLVSNYACANRCVYVSRSYSSVRLAHRLLDSGTTSIGLLTNNSDKLLSMSQERPLVGLIQKGVFIGRWKRGNTVFYSSEHPELETIDDDAIPKSIDAYNRAMIEDKLNDELQAYYTCERRQMSLDKKILIHMLQIILMNAYYLHRTDNEVKSTLYDFRLEVIRSLVEPDLSKWERQKSNERTNHRPVLLKQDSCGRPRRKKCQYCYYHNGVRQDSQYYCPNCPDLPGLCLDSCFRLYHCLQK